MIATIKRGCNGDANTGKPGGEPSLFFAPCEKIHKRLIGGLGRSCSGTNRGSTSLGNWVKKMGVRSATSSSTMIKSIFICFSLIAAPFAFSQNEWLTPENEAQIKTIGGRIRKGDLTAFADVSKMDAKVAVPYIFHNYIHQCGDGDKSATVEAARAAIKNVKGHGRYLKDLLERLHTGKTDSIDDFQENDVWAALGSIGTMEAAAVVAPYLFRSGPDYGPPKPGDDVIPMKYSTTAAYELGRMNLPNAPVSGDPVLYGYAEYYKWKKWAIEHKLVDPKTVTLGPEPKQTPAGTPLPRLEPLRPQ